MSGTNELPKVTKGRRFGSTKGDDLSLKPRIQKKVDEIVGILDLHNTAMSGLADMLERLDQNMAAMKERLDRIDPPGPPE